MSERPKGPPSLRLSGPKSNALAPMSRGNDTRALASSQPTGNITLERFYKETGAANALAAFKAAGDGELERRAREEAEATFERRVNEMMDEMDRGQLRLKLATVLDYTASTIGDVTRFVSEIKGLMVGLRRDFSQIDFLPISASGPNRDDGPVVHVGKVDDLEFYNRVLNQGYKRETPIGAGVIEAAKGEFFANPVEDRIDAIVAISDEFYEIFREHEAIMKKLKQSQVAVASLTSACAESHVKALSTLGDLGIVVDRSGSTMNPVNLIREFIINLKTNILRAQAIQKVRSQMLDKKVQIDPSKIRRSVGFGEHLRMKGFESDAKKIIQGGTRTAGALKA